MTLPLHERVHFRLKQDRPDHRSPGHDPEQGIYYEEVAYAMLAKGDAGRAYLLAEIHQVDTQRLRGILAARETAEQQRKELQSVLFPFLSDSRSVIVAETVEALRNLDVTLAAEELVPLLSHPSAYVRGAVLLV